MADQNETPQKTPPTEWLQELYANKSDDEREKYLSSYFYFRAKAQIYLRKGPAAYQQDDFFHVPRPEWNDETLLTIERGFRDVMHWKGLSPRAPFEGLGLEDLYRLIEIAHFQLEGLRSTPIDGLSHLATVELRHRVDRRPLQLVYRFLAEPAMAGAEGALPSETFGYTPENPILCDDPLGELLYLRTLRCPNGHAFCYDRNGSMSGRCPDVPNHAMQLPEPYNTLPQCVVDEYQLQCDEGEHRCKLYFDMYHRETVTQVAPTGLSIGVED